MYRYFYFIPLFLLNLVAYAQKPNTGLLFDDQEYQNTPMKARNVAFQSVVSASPKVSLKEFIPPVKNQGSYGTCVGWSTSYYGRTILQARMNGVSGEEVDANTFSPVFTYLQSHVEDDYNCQGGAYINKALQSMIEIGAAEYDSYNVYCDSYVPTAVFEEAKNYRIRDYTRLFGIDEPADVKTDVVKRSLLNGNPVIIGFQVENSFYYASGVYEPDNLGTDGGHAMCVIGYDDEKYGGAFEIVNSWGPDWGNNGFIWVRYEDFANYAKYGYEMIPFVKKEEKTLSGSLRLQLISGDEMEVKKGTGKYNKSVLGWQDVVVDGNSQSIGDYYTTNSYSAGTRYRMYTKVNKPAYVYVLAADSDGRNGILFPHSEDVSPYINYEDVEVVVPGEKYWFRLGGEVSSDYSVIIFSEEKINMEGVKRKLDEMEEGTLLDKLYVIFNKDLIQKENIQLKDTEVAFTADYAEGTMALLVVDIKRQ